MGADITTMSATKLQAAYDRRDAAHGASIKTLVAAGYGNERGSETRARAAATGEALAVAHVAASDAFFAVVAEMDARHRYHGTLRPIKRSGR